MSLEESCTTYLRKLIVVKPIYGWGWTRPDAPEIAVPNETNGVPFHFRSRIQDFFFFEGELRGAVGKIEEEDHIYNCLWVVFYTRFTGQFNFTNNLPYCNLQIGSSAPSLCGDWHEFTTGSPVINGYCIVGESVETIANQYGELFSE
jgi:hypothetical protein